jgi:acetyl-CoA carboxylase biotin carboxyl carrier protein
MVGTFYNREKPDAAPYVAVGSRVGPRTIVGQLEAMKLFNEVYAECSGVIAEILVDNAQFVEYGTVLFRVDPAG